MILAADFDPDLLPTSLPVGRLGADCVYVPGRDLFWEVT